MALAPILILGGKRIANLDELRATDDFEKLQIAAEHGRLLNWLRFHHYNDIATDVESLSENKDNPSFFEDVCYVLGIQCPKEYSAVGKQMPSAVAYETELLPLMRKILVNMIATYSLKNSNPTNYPIDNEEEDDNPEDCEIVFKGLFLQSTETLGLSERAQHFLDEVGIKSLGELCQKKYEKLEKYFSHKVLYEIEEKLTNLGLSFGMATNDIANIDFFLVPQVNFWQHNPMLTSWEVEVGDIIEKGQPVCKLECGFFCSQITTEHSCILRKIITPAGEEVEVGTPVAIMEII